MDVNTRNDVENDTLIHLADDLRRARESGSWEAVQIIEETIRGLYVTRTASKAKKQMKPAENDNPNIKRCEKCNSILEKTDMRYDWWCPGCSKYVRIM